MRNKIIFSVVCLLVLSLSIVCCSLNTGKQGGKLWITNTYPENDQKHVSSKSDISVEFNTDIDTATLNITNITIVEGKHSSVINDLYDINYDKAKRTLLLKCNSDYGTGNGIDVTLSGHIRNVKGEEMGVDYHFGFQTE